MMLSNSDSCVSNIAISLSVAQHQKSPAKAQRKVRFNGCRNQHFADSQISVEGDDEDSTTTWYASADYGQFRSNAHGVVMAALALKDGRSFVKTIKHVYDQVCKLDYVLEDAYEMMNSELEQQIKQLFLDNNIDLIGLECYVSSAIKKKYQQRREKIQDAVYDVQSEFEQGLWEVDEVDEELRDSCLNFSQSACLFAQLVAKGQVSV
jgi:hypothetical protein